MSKVNDNIRNFRIFRGLSQKQLGDALNKTPNVISNWETGTHSPDIETIERLCDILHVTPNEMFGWEVNKDFEEYKKSYKELSDRMNQIREQKMILEREYRELNAQLAEKEYLFSTTEEYKRHEEIKRMRSAVEGSRPHRSRKVIDTED